MQYTCCAYIIVNATPIESFNDHASIIEAWSLKLCTSTMIAQLCMRPRGADGTGIGRAGIDKLFSKDKVQTIEIRSQSRVCARYT